MVLIQNLICSNAATTVVNVIEVTFIFITTNVRVTNFSAILTSYKHIGKNNVILQPVLIHLKTFNLVF